MDWIEVTVRTNTGGADMVSELLQRHGSKGVSIADRLDAQPADEGPGRWDIPDPAVLAAMDEDVLVRGYFPAGAENAARLSSLKSALAALTPDKIGFDAGSLAVTAAAIRDEDWAESWKQHYKPFRVGERLVVKPVWEAYPANPDDIVLEMDPGPAFGNGTHETTAMCMALLEQAIRPGCAVLDIGTGSGILALAAAKLGAADVLAIDLDPVAVRVASENIARNGLDGIVRACLGDLLQGVDAEADLAVANIVADAIILLSGTVRERLHPGGAFLCSGIIRDREQDVLASLRQSGFSVLRIERRGEWVAMLAGTEA